MLTDLQLKDMKDLIGKLRLPENPTQTERILFRIVKEDMGTLLGEIDRLKAACRLYTLAPLPTTDLIS